MGLQAYLILAATVFCIGLFGVVTRRNTIGILLGIELMLNAVNISLIAFGTSLSSMAGQVFAVFVITLAAAEAAIGLGLILVLSRTRDTVDVTTVNLLKD